MNKYKKFVLVLEPAQKCTTMLFFKQKYTQKLAYSCCFTKESNVVFPDFLPHKLEHGLQSKN